MTGTTRNLKGCPAGCGSERPHECGAGQPLDLDLSTVCSYKCRSIGLESMSHHLNPYGPCACQLEGVTR